MEPLAVIPKNILEEIRVQWSEFKGRWYVHVRIYAGSGSEKRPTRKGITLRRDQIGPLMIALRKALHPTDQGAL